MKDIIEKYKKGELSKMEWINNPLRKNEDNSITEMVACELVVSSTQLDKEIAAMEKQYKYEKVEFDKASIALCDFESGNEQVTKDAVGNYVLVGDAQTSVIAWVGDNLYRRIELTQEELHEQKVEELGEFLKREFNTDELYGWKDVAKKALEWMKQEG